MEIPKGKLIAIGGNEDKGSEQGRPALKDQSDFFEFGILRRVLTEICGNDSRIEVITTASSIPEETGQNYIEAFNKLGCKSINVMHIKKREDALSPDYINRIKKADGVLFTGGDQMRLSMIFGGTEILEILKNRYMNERFVIAGTSAGAMAMSGSMIYRASRANILKDKINTTSGLGFIENVIIDSHFINRKRFARLTTTVASNPGSFGIGLGEDTGIIITKGHRIETIGSGMIVIFDGHDIKYSNIADVKYGDPLSIENLIVHVMAKGNCYLLKDRKFLVSAHELQKQNKKLKK